MSVPTPPVWMAAPPEVHSTLLTIGGTPAGIIAGGVSWGQLAAQYAAGIAEMEGIIASVQANYQGPSAEQFVRAWQPTVLWMADALAKCLLAAEAHASAAASYTSSVAAMPSMPELIENHTVHGVLIGTNFFGVNTVPIGMNEADYIRMWNLAADTMAAWDGASTLAADSIPMTPMAPPMLIPGVGESGAVSASAASFFTQLEGQLSGMALNGADMMGTKLLAGKAASTPAYAADGLAVRGNPENATNKNDLMQQAKPENMGSSLMQQMASMGPSAAQSVASAGQGGPQQMLSQAPQMLSQAPQQLSQLLGQFSNGAGGAQSGAMPVGFAGTGPVRGVNPAGMTSLASAGMGSGPVKPMAPSTWGSAPTSATSAESLANSRLAPVGASLAGGSGVGGTGAGGGMMGGGGAHGARGSRSQKVNSYNTSEPEVDEDADATRGRSL